MRIPVGGLFLLAALAAFASGCGAAPRGEAGQIDDLKEFRGFPLYALGDSFEGASLELVQRRPGFVEFVYGSEAPLLVQVWPGCVRNRLLHPNVLVEGAAFEHTVFVRGATAYVFEGGRRLEVPVRGATVVVRARDLHEARDAVQALEGVNNPLESSDPLPAVEPPEISARCRKLDPEAAGVAAALKEALTAYEQPAPPIAQCERSLAVARTDVVDDAHDCFTGASGGEALSWCVLSRSDDLFAGAFGLTCEAAVRTGVAGRPLQDEASLGWALRARVVCEPHLARVAEVIASVDQDRLNTDFSYVWAVMGAWEAAVVAELRALPEPPPEVGQILALYEERVAAIEAAVDEYHAGAEEEALAELRRIELQTPQLVARFEAFGAPACAPPW